MTETPVRGTATLLRFLQQEKVIRAMFSHGIASGETTLGADADWEAAVRYQIETACIRGVDNFLSYVSEILQLCMTRKPEMLRSGETVTLEEVQRFSRHADLISYLIDRTISRLSYKSFDEIEKYVFEKTNVELVRSDEERALLTIAVELRNIYSHNRGEASRATMARLRRFDHPLALEKGKRIEIDLSLVNELMDNLVSLAKRADDALARKFRLSRRSSSRASL